MQLGRFAIKEGRGGFHLPALVRRCEIMKIITYI
nr:MAG TPA: hypothetical protein [Caudoviricetes sp.]